MNSEINVKFEIDKTTVRLFVVIAALVALVVIGSMKVAAQEVAETVRINTRVVFMDALVKDKRTGVPIADLKPENFEIYDDGNLRPVSYFTREGQARKPLALVLILDLRDDGAGRFLKRPEILKAMADELAKLSPEDEVAILAIDINGEDEKRVWLSEFTHDHAQLVAALGRAPQFVDVDPAVADAVAAKANNTQGQNKNDADRGSSLTLGSDASASASNASNLPTNAPVVPSTTATLPSTTSDVASTTSDVASNTSALPSITSDSASNTSTMTSNGSAVAPNTSTSPSNTSVVAPNTSANSSNSSAKVRDSPEKEAQRDSSGPGPGTPRSDENVQVEVIKGKNGAVVTRTTRPDGSVDLKRVNQKGDVTLEIGGVYDMAAAVRDTTRKAQKERPHSQTAIVWVSDGIAPIFFEDRDATEQLVIRSGVTFNSLTTELRTLFKLLMPIGKPLAGAFGVSVYGSAKRLAQQSGGEALKVKRTKDYAAGLSKIIGNLTARYSLGFTLAEVEKDDGRLHNLEVKVKAPDAKGKTRKLEVSSRRGYYMSETGEKEKDATASKVQ